MSHSRQAVAEVRFSTRGAGLSSGPRLCPPCQPRGSLSALCLGQQRPCPGQEGVSAQSPSPRFCLLGFQLTGSNVFGCQHMTNQMPSLEAFSSSAG